MSASFPTNCCRIILRICRQPASGKLLPAVKRKAVGGDRVAAERCHGVRVSVAVQAFRKRDEVRAPEVNVIAGIANCMVCKRADHEPGVYHILLGVGLVALENRAAVVGVGSQCGIFAITPCVFRVVGVLLRGEGGPADHKHIKLEGSCACDPCAIRCPKSIVNARVEHQTMLGTTLTRRHQPKMYSC